MIIIDLENDGNAEIGKKLKYPQCCVDYFTKDNVANPHNVSWGGFIPCLKHKDLSLEEIVQLLGRNPLDESDITKFGRCHVCNETFEGSQLEGCGNGLRICSDCDRGFECTTCHEEFPHEDCVHLIKGRTCLVCFSKMSGIQIDEKSQIFLSCCNSYVPFMDAFYDFDESMDKAEITLKCNECGEEHKSSFVID